MTSSAGLNDAGDCMCIAHNRPEDGRVADDTGPAGEGLKSELSAPLSTTKTAYFPNSTPQFKSSSLPMNRRSRKKKGVGKAALDKSNLKWHPASHFKGNSEHT